MTAGLYIDPSAHLQACATLLDGELAEVRFVHFEAFMAWPPNPRALTAVVIEQMVIYDRPGEEDPNDLLAVHGAARFAECGLRMRGAPAATWWSAADWKGGIKKWHHHQRLWSIMSPAERAVFARDTGHTVDYIARFIDDACERWARGDVTKAGKLKGYKWAAHNLFDAFGIGAKHAGRVGRAGHRF